MSVSVYWGLGIIPDINTLARSASTFFQCTNGCTHVLQKGESDVDGHFHIRISIIICIYRQASAILKLWIILSENISFF